MSTVWTLEADLDRDGSFETDLTPYVVNWGGGWRITRGIDRDGLYQSSTLSVVLDNSTGAFTPENDAGLFYGQFAENPDAPIQLVGETPTDPYIVWAGYVHDIEVSDPADGTGTATLVCRDMGQIIAEAPPVYIPVSTTRTVTDALEAVANYIGIPAGGQDFDADARVLPYHFAVAMAPMDAFMDIVRSSYGGMLFISKDGTLRYTAPDQLLGVGGGVWGDSSAIIPSRVDYEVNRFDFVDAVAVRSTVFYEAETDVDMFRTGYGDVPFMLAAGEVWTRSFDMGAFISFIAPVASTDYQANSAADFSGTDTTADLDVVATDTGTGRINLRLENTNAGAVYVRLRIRGIPFNFHAERPEARASLPVAYAAAGSELPVEIPFGDATGTIARDYAVHLLRTYRHPYPRLTLMFEHTTDAVADEMLGEVELGEPLYFSDVAKGIVGLYIAEWFRVVAIQHEWRPTDVARTTLTMVPTYLGRDVTAIAYDEFDRANATGDLGQSTSLHTWATDTGFNIATEAARANTDTLSMATLDLGAGALDQFVEVELAAIGAGDEVGVVFGYIDANNQYRAYLDKGSNELILEKNVATVVTELSSPAFTVGTAHEIGILRQDERIRVYVDGVRRIDTTDAALITGTKIGIMARNASGTTTFKSLVGQKV